jgi:hypothetical protein
MAMLVITKMVHLNHRFTEKSSVSDIAKRVRNAGTVMNLGVGPEEGIQTAKNWGANKECL